MNKMNRLAALGRRLAKWLLAGAWISIFAITHLARVLRGESTESSYGNA